MSTETNPIRAAVDALGGAAAAAEKLDCSVQAVYLWISGKRKFPAEMCPLVERLTDGAVRCEQLRPEIEWAVLRRQAA